MAAHATVVWFRQDLRLTDHPALRWAVARGGPVIPLFVWAPREEGDWSVGRVSCWWLLRSLQALDKQLRRLGSRLIVRKGRSVSVLRSLTADTAAKAVCWNRRYEPAAIERDAKVEKALRADGLDVAVFNASLVFDAGTVLNRAGQPFRVFTPFYKHCTAMAEPALPEPAPRRLPRPRALLKTLDLSSRQPFESGARAPGGADMWTPGEQGASAALERFVADGLIDYPGHRDRPDLEGTSRLSPHLHWGEIGPRQVWHAVRARGQRAGRRVSEACACYLRQLVWREFAYHLLYHFPQTPLQPLRPEFEQFPWRTDDRRMAAWQQGRTGYPIVDAGMRELARTGWMHNRVRMVVASFLVKDLLLPWQQGARWFWDMLVDADLANNTLGWQWAAGCGADAAPFFRIFNPVRQGERFDPEGDYVRLHVPELRSVADRWLHAPFKAGPALFKNASGRKPPVYPGPIVDHAQARQRALEAFSQLRRSRRR